MHSCWNCRRVLRFSVRDVLCLQCLGSINHDTFGEEVTRPGILPTAVLESENAVDDAA